MSDLLAGELVLSGQASQRLYENFYRPSAEYISTARNTLENITRGITITRTVNGFDADIAGLDLSCLDNIYNDSN